MAIGACGLWNEPVPRQKMIALELMCEIQQDEISELVAQKAIPKTETGTGALSQNRTIDSELADADVKQHERQHADDQEKLGHGLCK